MVTPIYELAEAMMPIYVDAVLYDENRQFLILSIWGQETETLSLLGRLSLPDHEDGLKTITLIDTANSKKKLVFDAPNHRLLKKYVAKTPSNTVFGALCHMFIYREDVVFGGDRSEGRGYVIETDGSKDSAHLQLRIWDSINAVCQIPLLDTWRPNVMQFITEQGWVRHLEGFGLTGAETRVPPDEFEQFISQGLRSGLLEPPEINQQGEKHANQLDAPIRQRGQLDLLI